MKKIVLFTGGTETLAFFSRQLAGYLKELGHDVFLFDLYNIKMDIWDLRWFCEGGNVVTLTFNFNGICGEEIFLNEDGTFFWDTLDIPVINIVVDHPFYYHKYLNHLPQKYVHISIDRFHEAYMKEYFPEVALGPLVPLAGTALKPLKDTLPIEKRPYDIVFTGNYTSPHAYDNVIERNGPEYANFYHGIIDDLIAHPDTPMEKAFYSHIKREMPELSTSEVKQCMESLIFIDLYVRFYFRAEAIRTLADNGLPVKIYGKGWDELSCAHPENIHFENKLLTSLECLEGLEQGKISLNVMPWFKDGAHDRIFNSQLNGAVCLTDESIYLKEIFTDGKEICFYSLDKLDELPKIATGLLSDNDLLLSIQENGYQAALENHTWGDRAVILSNYIERYS
ncbi:MAG: glycosyltransferase [Lachnospiraceae bacterium]|nr:glycosyltransferase [Lachnospiraceae bacterium]